MTPVISLLKTRTIIEIQTRQIKPKPLKELQKKKRDGINHKAGLQIHNDNLNPRKNNS